MLLYILVLLDLTFFFKCVILLLLYISRGGMGIVWPDILLPPGQLVFCIHGKYFVTMFCINKVIIIIINCMSLWETEKERTKREGGRLCVSVSMSLSSPWPYLMLRNTREGFMPDEPLEKGAGRVSRGCGSLCLKQSDEYNDKKWTGKSESPPQLPLSFFLLSVLFSSAELNALAMNREITLGRSWRQEDLF